MIRIVFFRWGFRDRLYDFNINRSFSEGQDRLGFKVQMYATVPVRLKDILCEDGSPWHWKLMLSFVWALGVSFASSPALTRGVSPVLSARGCVVEDGASRMEILMTVSKFASFCTMVSARQSRSDISLVMWWLENCSCTGVCFNVRNYKWNQLVLQSVLAKQFSRP